MCCLVAGNSEISIVFFFYECSAIKLLRRYHFDLQQLNKINSWPSFHMGKFSVSYDLLSRCFTQEDRILVGPRKQGQYVYKQDSLLTDQVWNIVVNLQHV